MSCWIDRSSRTLEQPAVSIRTLWRAHSFPPGRTPTRKHTLQDTPEKQIQTWCSRACMEHTRLPNFFFFSPPLIFKSITHYSSSWRSGVAGPGIHHSSAHARVFSPASRTGASIGTERRDALPRSTEDIYFKFSSRLPKLFFFFFQKDTRNCMSGWIMGKYVQSNAQDKYISISFQSYGISGFKDLTRWTRDAVIHGEI